MHLALYLIVRFTKASKPTDTQGKTVVLISLCHAEIMWLVEK